MKYRSVQNVNRSDVGTVINEQVVWNYPRGVVVLGPWQPSLQLAVQ